MKYVFSAVGAAYPTADEYAEQISQLIGTSMSTMAQVACMKA